MCVISDAAVQPSPHLPLRQCWLRTSNFYHTPGCYGCQTGARSSANPTAVRGPRRQPSSPPTAVVEPCQNNGRPEMADRRWPPEVASWRRHVRRWQPPEPPSTGSGDSLPFIRPGESLRPVVYGGNVPPSTLFQSNNSLSSSLPIPIFQQTGSLYAANHTRNVTNGGTCHRSSLASSLGTTDPFCSRIEDG